MTIARWMYRAIGVCAALPPHDYMGIELSSLQSLRASMSVEQQGLLQPNNKHSE